jgi:hypothetical protein
MRLPWPAVNTPGFAWAIDAAGVPSVAPCPVNTYSPGFRRQRTCWSCPQGYSTNGLSGQVDVTACGESPGHAALPESPTGCSGPCKMAHGWQTDACLLTSHLPVTTHATPRSDSSRLLHATATAGEPVPTRPMEGRCWACEHMHGVRCRRHHGRRGCHITTKLHIGGTRGVYVSHERGCRDSHSYVPPEALLVSESVFAGCAGSVAVTPLAAMRVPPWLLTHA